MSLTSLKNIYILIKKLLKTYTIKLTYLSLSRPKHQIPPHIELLKSTQKNLIFLIPKKTHP